MGIRSIAYFPSQAALNSTQVLNAILDGARRHGIKPCQDSLDADAAVIWSVLWSGRMAPNKTIFQHYRSQGKPVIIVDIGALHRGHTWKIALNHITNRGFYGHQENLDIDRPKKLGIFLKENDHPRPGIIVAAQHTSSLQVQDVNLISWLDKKISDVKKITDRPIILRPHPRCRIDLQRFQRLGVEIQSPRLLPRTYDDFDFDTGYHAVINYNSGPGIQAAIAGTRPVVDSSSLASPVSIGIEEIEQSYGADRYHWLVEICHTEYTIDEIEQGNWIERLHLKND